MGHEAVTWAYEQIVRHSLKPGQQATLLRLCNHANPAGKCWPSIEHLAAYTNQNERTVRRHLDEFVEIGIIQREIRAGSGSGRQTNVYSIVGQPDILSGRATGHFEQATGHQMSDCPPNTQTINRTSKYRSFDLFWTVYPVKVKRKTAREIWQRKKLDAIADELIADVKNRIESDGQWLSGFIPHPTTYLNQHRWKDAITPPRGLTHGKTQQSSSGVSERRRALAQQIRDLESEAARESEARVVSPGGDVRPDMGVTSR